RLLGRAVAALAQSDLVTTGPGHAHGDADGVGDLGPDAGRHAHVVVGSIRRVARHLPAPGDVLVVAEQLSDVGVEAEAAEDAGAGLAQGRNQPDRKSTRLNSSHVKISYAVLC